MGKCKRCVQDRRLCFECRDNPVYANVPRRSRFIYYNSVCPYGYPDCVYDPAYYLATDAEYYEEEFGDKTPEEVIADGWCNHCVDGCHYDDEDK